MPRYEYKCPTCGLEFEQVSHAVADTAGYVYPEHCGVRAQRQMSLIAARPVWSPSVSYRHGKKPITIDNTQHDNEVRRKLGLMSRADEHDLRGSRRIGNNVDSDAFRQVMRERISKRKEAARRRVDLKRMNMPTTKDYLKPWDSGAEVKARIKKAVVKGFKKSMAKAGMA